VASNDLEQSLAPKRFCWFNPCHLLAVGLGSGFSPRVPGTVGTLAALPLWWLLSQCHVLLYGVLLIVSIVIGIVICGRTAADLGGGDPSVIVWDEFVGLWITLWAMPSQQWQWVMIGFVLFRVLDISKPWPISWIDRSVHGGLGIMLDDIVAGFLAALLLNRCGSYWSFC
jgi:phosphatidylglycerophosphatase A